MTENGRANKAYQYCENAKTAGILDGYYSRARSAPSMLQTNGLAAMVAFLFSKRNESEKSYFQLYLDIENWLKSRGHIGQSDRLVEKVTALDKDNYRIISTEVMALLGWLKRFATGMKEKKDA